MAHCHDIRKMSYSYKGIYLSYTFISTKFQYRKIEQKLRVLLRIYYHYQISNIQVQLLKLVKLQKTFAKIVILSHTRMY